MIKLKTHIIACVVMIMSLTNCTKKSLIKKKIDINAIQPKIDAQEINIEEQPRVTIWVHGTKSVGKISDRIHATHEQGLLHITSIPPRYHLGDMIKTISQADPIRYPMEHCYAFGWSGALSFEARQKEAQKLYDAIKLLIKHYQTSYNATPIITLITHSHGGNVVLNLATIKDPHDDFVIDQAILLACPVQNETKHLIEDPIFKKIYAFYSTMDMLQILDPQGMYITEHNKERKLELSQRQFPHNPKLRQTRLKIDKVGLPHAGFILCKFVKLLPGLVDETERWEHEQPSTENQERLLIITT